MAKASSTLSQITGPQQQVFPAVVLLPRFHQAHINIELQNEQIEIHINKLSIIQARLGVILHRIDQLQKDFSELIMTIDSSEDSTFC